MSERSGHVFARYWLFQLPGMFVAIVVLSVLVHWELVDTRTAALLFGFWVLKDLVMYPIVRIGYETRSRPAGAEALIGAVGVVQQEIGDAEEGWVRLGPELWRAVLQGSGAAPVGAEVRVVAVRGLVLSVEEVEGP